MDHLRPRASIASTQASTPKPTSPTPKPTSSPDQRLSNGTVAGIVIAVAIGLALLTFLITFFIMRHKQSSQRKRLQKGSQEHTPLETGSMRKQNKPSNPKEPLVAEIAVSSRPYESYLPQSADDNTVKNKVRTLLDQIEDHIDSFYSNARDSEITFEEAGVNTFDSAQFSDSLFNVLPRTRKAISILKHALSFAVTSAISTNSQSRWPLLPDEFVLLPRAIISSKENESLKPGFEQSLSRWRILTTYLRPNPSQDRLYIEQRDSRIQDLAQSFSGAFAAWKNPKYKDENRIQSLSAILVDAAELGIWLFSQPCDLQFSWQTRGSKEIAVAPTLLKMTDERGQKLIEPQVLT